MAVRQEQDRTVRAAAGNALAGVLFGAALLLHASPAAALSEIKPEEGISEIRREILPPPARNPELPSNSAADRAAPDEGKGNAGEEPGSDGEETVAPEPTAPLPDVQYDLASLPEPVRRMQNLLVEAAKSGDIEQLRPLITAGRNGTQLTFGDDSGDPIAFLRGTSGDGEGHEILAILEEVLQAGFVHLDEGTSEELYVWPYFFGLPLEKLTPRQRVELFKIVTAGDYEDMKTYGAYIFYRVGITPDGVWAFFVAGD